MALILLADVRWRGRPVAGERPRALLAALAAGECRTVPAEKLIERVWGEDPPANAVKALQVLVSRVRTACGADVIVRDNRGYRLGCGPGEVDSLRVAACARNAAATLDKDPATAGDLAREAMTLAGDLLPADEDGPLADVRRAAAGDAADARVILARAASRTGAHGAALTPLEDAHARHPGDEALLADLLRSEADVRGPAVALDRFERYRAELRDRLGTDPGEPLRRAYQALLALDHPVRQGVRYDSTSLIGRDGDLMRLPALLAGARVVSILGPGGIGKTRLAHAVARTASEPSVHVVELVGVTSSDDVVAEVGSVLGVRDSVAGRRVLTPEQRADVRGRIATVLGQSPSLLVLDNCEHLIEAVADLVAFLVSAAPDLRVLTTSRAPLSIAAERIYPLGELSTADAVRLFTERSVAARPGARLPEETVARIVARLDGLPLAIELAAAKVRAMSAEEIDRRLEDRFALLRGGDRSAPDRHQTLLAVIEWSWNLLDSAEQRALRWLALFHDGFTLEAAETVLARGDDPPEPPDAVDAVQGLVDQSLLSVQEAPDGIRYRMLETVREFGRLRLAEADEEQAARGALRQWAAAYARRHGDRVAGPGQFAAIDALAAEETNLADELRAALADGDRESLVRLLAPLGLFWTIRGHHDRLVIVADAVTKALRGWEPPSDLAEETLLAVAITLSNALMTGVRSAGPLRETLQRLCSSPDRDARATGLVRVLLAYQPGDEEASIRELSRLAEHEDRHTAIAANQWLIHLRENAGDPDGAIIAAERQLALARPEDGPWGAAMAHVMLTDLTMHLGDNRATALRHAHAALPVMERLGANDDELQVRAAIVMAAIAESRLAEAEDELAGLKQAARGRAPADFGRFVYHVADAELMLARGEVAEGLRAYRECALRMRDVRIPGSDLNEMRPWNVAGDSMALSAHAFYAASGPDEVRGRELLAVCEEHAARIFGSPSAFFDVPASGLLLYALGTWSLLRDGDDPETALRLLALAHRFRYNRGVPSMAWDRITPAAEKAAPGKLAAFQAEYAGREPAGLLAEAGRLCSAAR